MGSPQENGSLQGDPTTSSAPPKFQGTPRALPKRGPGRPPKMKVRPQATAVTRLAGMSAGVNAAMMGGRVAWYTGLEGFLAAWAAASQRLMWGWALMHACWLGRSLMRWQTWLGEPEHWQNAPCTLTKILLSARVTNYMAFLVIV